MSRTVVKRLAVAAMLGLLADVIALPQASPAPGRAAPATGVPEPDTHFTVPEWISESGVGGRDEANPDARRWFENFTDFLVDTDADFAYWPLVGFHHNRGGNGWALLHRDATGGRMGLFDGDDWRADAWRKLVGSPGMTGPVGRADTWDMPAPDHGDTVRSLRMRALPDRDRGAQGGVPDRSAPCGSAPR